MNRRLLVFFVLVNAFVSLAIAVTVVWLAEQRRPGPEELVVPVAPTAVLIATPTSGNAQATQEAGSPVPATPTEAAPPPDLGETEVYTVEEGDSLSAIAARYGVSPNWLMEINDVTDPNLVFIGQRLIIPVSPQGGAAQGGSEVGLPEQGLRLEIVNAGELAAESVRVANDSNAAVDLQGWSLSSDGGPLYTFGSALLLPGSWIFLHTGTGEDNSVNRYWGHDAAVWHSGTTVVLRDASGELIAQNTVAGGE